MEKEVPIYKTLKDDSCKEFLDLFVKCEKESIASEGVCDNERKLYLKCREDFKEKEKENSFKVKIATKNLYFSNDPLNIVISKK